MTRLLLLRHAKAAWAEPGRRDFDRALDPEGVEESQAIGAAMLARGLLPEIVLCSTALRARQTWDVVAPFIGHDAAAARFTDLLYSADAAGYMDLIRDVGDAASLLVIGHNPMIEDVAIALAGQSEQETRAALANGFPTAGLAVFSLADRLSEASPRRAGLDAFVTPATL